MNLSSEDLAYLNRLLTWIAEARLADGTESVNIDANHDDRGTWRLTVWAHFTDGECHRMAEDERRPSFGAAIASVLNILPAPLAVREAHDEYQRERAAPLGEGIEAQVMS
ncbi:MAG TPA: hypothetical protein VFV10_15850 [Gammaproteobacteria bacterium]|nr:hypothetical protein [Gammaproteobacteria bacterium]